MKIIDRDFYFLKTDPGFFDSTVTYLYTERLVKFHYEAQKYLGNGFVET